MLTPSSWGRLFRLFLHQVYTQFDPMSSVFSQKFLGVFLHQFAPPLPPNSAPHHLYNSRFTTAFLLELYVEVTPPPPRHFQYPLPPPSALQRRQRSGSRQRSRHSNRPTTQPLAQRRLKRFTRRRRFSSHKLQRRHTKKTDVV